ncbi:MAG: hypothetical protein ACR2NU_01545 [Aeoliella sp.]
MSNQEINAHLTAISLTQLLAQENPRRIQWQLELISLGENMRVKTELLPLVRAAILV